MPSSLNFISGQNHKFKQIMKKLFKKGLIALTLMLGMTFAAPQSASATNNYKRSETYREAGILVVISYYDDHSIRYYFDDHGNVFFYQWVTYGK